jgi:hypothetical protein
MTSAAAPASPQERRISAPPGPVVRWRALARAADRSLRSRLGAQLAKLFSWIIGLGYAVALLLLARGTGGDLLHAPVIDALGWLSWLSAGLVGLSAAAAAKQPAELEALSALAAQRGFGPAALRDARGLAAIRRIVRLTLPPALALSLLALALSGSLGLALARLLLCLGVIGYVHLLALLLGGLAHVAATLAPRQGRSLFLMLLFVPHLARVVWPNLPSVPWALGWLLDWIARLGPITP